MHTEKYLWRTHQSGRFILCIVYISLFFDNMLLTIVVPIIPDFLYHLENESMNSSLQDGTLKEFAHESQNYSNSSYIESKRAVRNASFSHIETDSVMIQKMMKENEEVGLLFASKAIVQLVVNPFVGPLINRVGCSTPLFFGTLILMSSCLLFAFGEIFMVLLIARSIQGVGSACISVAGMAMIADKYSDDKERCKVMGIAMGGIAAGVLMGYPFGSIMYNAVGKEIPLLILTCLMGLDLIVLLVFLRPELESERLLVGTSLSQLLVDPYIMLSSGAICVSTLAISTLEPCLPLWLMESMTPPKWQLGLVFLPDSFGYLIGTHCFGSIAFKLGRWRISMGCLFVVGLCAIMIPLSTHILQLMVPHFGLGLGIGVLDASLMPLLAYFVDSRYVALYGTVYAIAQTAVCLAYSIGPLLGGYLVKFIGFPGVMRTVGVLNLLYCPLCYFLSSSVTETSEAINLKCLNQSKEPTCNEGRTRYSSFANQN